MRLKIGSTRRLKRHIVRNAKADSMCPIREVYGMQPKHGKAADIPYLSSHKLRFTVASILYNGGHGIDVKILQRILGHSNLAMTLHYVGAYDGDPQTPEIAAEMDKFLSLKSV